MSETTLINLGLMALAVVVLLPVILVVRVLIAIFLDWRSARAGEARRTSVALADLGEFTSTDDHNWSGRIGEIAVMLTTTGRRPSPSDAERVRAHYDHLPALADRARDYLDTIKDVAWPTGGPAALLPEALDVEAAADAGWGSQAAELSQ